MTAVEQLNAAKVALTAAQRNIEVFEAWRRSALLMGEGGTPTELKDSLADLRLLAECILDKVRGAA